MVYCYFTYLGGFMRGILLLFILISTKGFCFTPEKINGTSLNRMGVIAESVNNVDLSEVDKYIVPEDWQLFFEDNSYRNLTVSARRGQGWHDAFDQIGKRLLLTVLIDGSTKFVVIAKPFAEFEAGAQVINMKAISYSNNSILENVFMRAQVNELNYQSEIMRQKFADYEVKKNELFESMASVKQEQEELEKQSIKLKQETYLAMEKQQRKQEEIDNKIMTLRKYSDRDSTFVFYASAGLVKENIKKLAAKIGYSSVTFDERIPEHCDWIQESKEALKGVSGEQVMAEYANRYEMNLNTLQNIAYLTFFGSIDKFENCSGAF